MPRKFIFVYNADSGLFNTATDIAHKILSPGTYSCNLCALTHGHFKVRDSWVKYLKESESEFEFLHKDEFIKRYAQSSFNLPAIFESRENQPALVFDRDKINSLSSLDQLIDLMAQA